jgi:hypothetical protein
MFYFEKNISIWIAPNNNSTILTSSSQLSPIFLKDKEYPVGLKLKQVTLKDLHSKLRLTLVSEFQNEVQIGYFQSNLKMECQNFQLSTTILPLNTQQRQEWEALGGKG